MNIESEIRAKSVRGLSKWITLMESSKPEDQESAFQFFQQFPPQKIFKVGVTGPPGVGKSSFLTQLVEKLTKKNKKCALILIDPSSVVSKGSVLGDKTRMQKLLNSDQVYIRPVPSKQEPGGLSPVLAGTMDIISAFDFDVVFVETVGAGQNDINIRQFTDLLLLLDFAQLGDAVQEIKKGVQEHFDAKVFTKKDLYDPRVGKTEGVFSLSAVQEEGWENFIAWLEEKWAIFEKTDTQFSPSLYFDHEVRRMLLKTLPQKMQQNAQLTEAFKEAFIAQKGYLPHKKWETFFQKIFK